MVNRTQIKDRAAPITNYHRFHYIYYNYAFSPRRSRLNRFPTVLADPEKALAAHSSCDGICDWTDRANHLYAKTDL